MLTGLGNFCHIKDSEPSFPSTLWNTNTFQRKCVDVQVKALQRAANLSSSEIHAPAFSSAPLVPTAASAVPLRKIKDKHKTFEDKSSGLEDTLCFLGRGWRMRRRRIAIHHCFYHLSGTEALWTLVNTVSVEGITP